MPPAEADTPFAPSVARQQRIRVRAYHLWESEGGPAGQSDTYWERARELDALEFDRPAPPSERVPAEEASLQENLGEFPSLFTDQGDSMPTPESREIAREFRDGER